MDDTKQNIGSRIKHLRMERGMTQTALAVAVGVSTEAISNMERGVNYPSFENLFKIAATLKFDLVDILSGVDKPRKRAEAEGKILATVKSLTNDRLELAVKVISALA